MSESFIYSVGLNNVGSYQVSGIPFLSGGVNASTAVKVTFPYVTRWVAFANRGTGVCKVGFSQNGVEGTRYFRLGGTGGPTADSVRFEVKVTEVWLSGSTSVDIMAGLTNIPVDRVNNLANSPSGSNWSGSANV
jgi:hypothetical protein